MSYNGSLCIDRNTIGADLYSLRDEIVELWNDNTSTGEIRLTREIIKAILTNGYVVDGEVYSRDTLETINHYSDWVMGGEPEKI